MENNENEIANFIIEKIIEKKREKKSILSRTNDFEELVKEIKKEATEKLGINEEAVDSGFGKLEREQIIPWSDNLNLDNLYLTPIGDEIINKYRSYLKYKEHILNEKLELMKPIEHCLDNILIALELNWNKQKDGIIIPLNATELLHEFGLAGRYEFLKGLIRKLENEGYVEFKDSDAGTVNNKTHIDFYIKETLITVKGYYFIKNEKGYAELLRKSKEISENQKEISRVQQAQQLRLESIQKRNLLLTRILALGAGIAAWYYGIEIWKFHNPWWH